MSELPHVIKALFSLIKPTPDVERLERQVKAAVFTRDEVVEELRAERLSALQALGIYYPCNIHPATPANSSAHDCYECNIKVLKQLVEDLKTQRDLKVLDDKEDDLTQVMNEVGPDPDGKY